MCNRAEAAAVAQLVTGLLAGLPSSSVGVICFYRAQVTLITGLLGGSSGGNAQRGGSAAGCSGDGVEGEGGEQAPAGGRPSDVQVATVDSFQVSLSYVCALGMGVRCVGPRVTCSYDYGH